MASKQRVALVTGGAKRVGRAIVQRLADEGFQIAFTYHSSAKEARRFQRQLGKNALAIEVDLSAPEQAVEAVFDQVKEKFGRLNVLVNSASAYLPGRLQQTDTRLMQKLFAIHVQAPLLLCQKFEPMLRAGRGHVVNMVDLLAERPWPQFLAYCAGKAALANLTLGLARELAPEVTVNAIAPGVVDWPADFPQKQKARYLKRVPLARAGTPQDVARLVHFLCTEGSYITGQIIRLDGGRSVT